MPTRLSIIESRRGHIFDKPFVGTAKVSLNYGATDRLMIPLTQVHHEVPLALLTNRRWMYTNNSDSDEAGSPRERRQLCRFRLCHTLADITRNR